MSTIPPSELLPGALTTLLNPPYQVFQLVLVGSIIDTTVKMQTAFIIFGFMFAMRNNVILAKVVK